MKRKIPIVKVTLKRRLEAVIKHLAERAWKC